jgi:hypothetical protein
MNTRSLITLALLGSGLFAAGAALQPGGPARQPEVIRPGPFTVRPASPQYVAWVPPGTYTAIVLNSSGDERRWAVSLMYADRSVPIVVPPRDNIVIPFAGGWKVEPGDEARIVSSLVPFDDSSRYNKFGERPDYVLSAWGITAGGPVPFVYRKVQE